MNLIIYFESMLSEIFKIEYTIYPESIGLQEKSLSFERIQSIGSFEEASKYLIDKEVENTMRKDFDDWSKYFVKERKLKLTYAQEVKEIIEEIYSRRNLFVHNGGIVNSIYTSKVKEPYRQGIKIGEKLKVDRVYINKSIDLIERVGTLIILELLYHEEKSNTGLLDDIMSIAYDYLKDRKWNTAVEIYKLLMEDKRYNKLKQSDKMEININYWLGMKWMNKTDEVSEEIKNQDFSALSIRYQLPILALRDDYEEFFKLLPTGCPSSISYEDMQNWPVFIKVREQLQYNDFMKANKDSQEVTEQETHLKEEISALCKKKNYIVKGSISSLTTIKSRRKKSIKK